MDKRSIVDQIIARLDAELQRFAEAAREAAAGATDEQSRAENKYDTRGLEASYLAAGQSRQALEAAMAREAFATIEWRDFAPNDAAGLGALVELSGGGERYWCFLAPAAGGTEVECAGQEVLVLTANSPLGRAVWGRRAKERVRVDSDSAEQTLISVR